MTRDPAAGSDFKHGDRPATIPVFVINLDRSPDRYARVAQSAARYGIAIERVPGIDGASLDLPSLPGIEPRTFARVNGRPMLAGEAGCYLSHMKAIRTFIEGDADMALICEDDVDFTDETMPFLRDLSQYQGWDIVKLFSFRTHGFIRHGDTSGAVAIGRCLAGPVGSSAAYAISRAGAERFLKSLEPMIVPYDVALERGWHGSVRVFMTERKKIALQPEQPSTISDAYSGKYPFYRRVGTLFFRASEYLKRMHFARSATSLRKGSA
ncbi:glycosyl transferase [Aliihoeflea aestuarii]|uniref:glycosyltransferase family 25 protein n=1 Tax=Aliihoeflea aestuarii TaxID=453840 RepID=UPI002094150D|nr:glycosyltransferase family 25 protein [Aliihoeflea aestuarii]MCO6393060.1 glycosyl transferase [Aliihoeflea aestuarii]